MFVCASVCAFHEALLSPLLHLITCVSIPVCVCLFPRMDERNWVAGSTKTHQRRLIASTPHPHPPLSASLLFVAALSLHSCRSSCRRCRSPVALLRPLRLLVFSFFFPPFFLFSFFFPLMSTEWLQRASCLSHTHLIYQTTKDKKNDRIEEESQNKMGTAVARLFLPPLLLLLLHSWCQEKHIFKVSPQFSQQRPDSGL